MDSWFSRNVNVAPKYGLPNTTTIKMDSWVLSFKGARSVYDQLIKEKIWRNIPAQKEIANMLRRKGLVVPKSCYYRSFGDLSQPVKNQDNDYINQRVVSMSSDLDDMSAALGNFVFNVLVAGNISSEDKSGHKVEITEVGVYVKDSYDFNGYQFLGYWDDSDNSVSMINPFSGTAVYNQDFRNWRTANLKGGDFQVFSDIKRIKLTTPDVFFIE